MLLQANKNHPLYESNKNIKNALAIKYEQLRISANKTVIKLLKF